MCVCVCSMPHKCCSTGSVCVCLYLERVTGTRQVGEMRIPPSPHTHTHKHTHTHTHQNGSGYIKSPNLSNTGGTEQEVAGSNDPLYCTLLGIKVSARYKDIIVLL